MPEPLSSQPKSELEQALEDTINTISQHCVLRIESKALEARVTNAARQAWRDHYEEPFRKAIEEKKRHWKDDRDQVLERARQVGYLAAYVATLRSVFDELRRAGIPFVPGDATPPGQDIWLEPAYQPLVDARIAATAARFIDCDMKPQVTPSFIWCPAPTPLKVQDLMAITMPRRASHDEGEHARPEAERH